jgi:diphthamide biosynthesis protein 3
LLAGEEIATCPSCSLIVKVIYDHVRQIGKSSDFFVIILTLQEALEQEQNEVKKLSEDLKKLEVTK